MNDTRPMESFQDFKQLCDTVRQQAPRRLERDRPVVIFGAGQFGQALCRVLKADGFRVEAFLESAPRESDVQSVPVVTWGQLESRHREAQLAVGIFNHRAPMAELAELARNAGFADPFMPWDLYTQFGDRLGWRFWLGHPDVVGKNLASIEKVCSQLADDDSRKCFLRTLAFRLGRDLSFGNFSSAENHYFNELTLPALAGRQVRYVDGGAYSGDTFVELAGHVTIARAFLFEPDQLNFDKLVETASARDIRAVCLPLALTDRYQILSFSSGQGEGSAITEQGSTHIAAAALDQIIPGEHIDFIKLDIEGAEISALRGATGIISKSRPVMAISLYHRPEDIWEIPEFLFSICPNYRFYIRQHCYNSFESVLYAVPNPV